MLETLHINYSDQKLDLDYLVFNLPRFRTQIREVAEIFHKYGFNSRTFNYDTEKYSTTVGFIFLSKEEFSLFLN